MVAEGVAATPLTGQRRARRAHGAQVLPARKREEGEGTGAVGPAVSDRGANRLSRDEWLRSEQ